MTGTLALRQRLMCQATTYRGRIADLNDDDAAGLGIAGGNGHIDCYKEERGHYCSKHCRGLPDYGRPTTTMTAVELDPKVDNRSLYSYPSTPKRAAAGPKSPFPARLSPMAPERFPLVCRWASMRKSVPMTVLKDVTVVVTERFRSTVDARRSRQGRRQMAYSVIMIVDADGTAATETFTVTGTTTLGSDSVGKGELLEISIATGFKTCPMT